MRYILLLLILTTTIFSFPDNSLYGFPTKGNDLYYKIYFKDGEVVDVEDYRLRGPCVEFVYKKILTLTCGEFTIEKHKRRNVKYDTTYRRKLVQRFIQEQKEKVY